MEEFKTGLYRERGKDLVSIVIRKISLNNSDSPRKLSPSEVNTCLVRIL
jgi:hypothetical protein